MRPNSDKAAKRLNDTLRLMRWHRAWHREQRQAALAGPHGPALAELLRMFESLKSVQPAQLLGYASSIDWSAIPFDVRLTVLHEANDAITRYREKCGLAPIDDALPGEPLRVFQLLRAIVTANSSFPQSREGPTPGSGRPNPGK